MKKSDWMWVDVGRCGSRGVEGGQNGGRGEASVSVCKQTVYKVSRSLNSTRQPLQRSAADLKADASAADPSALFGKTSSEGID